jgi:hypothetical protein
MADRAAQELRGRPHDPRHETRSVDDGVPLPAGEGGKVAVAVAAKLLGLREELRVRLPAVEERQLVATPERCLGSGAAEELRPAEDQQPQTTRKASSRRSTSSGVL